MGTYFKLGILMLMLVASHAQARTFYVDAQKGNDANAGTTPSKAWNSLQKVNETIFQPGDKILFRSGTSYNGQLEVKGMGTLDQPIIVDRYGEGELPIIHGHGEKDYTILVENTSYWELNNLAVTNTGAERKPNRTGVLVRAWNCGESKHIHLKNLVVRNVNGSLVKQQGGGSAIFWQNGGDSIPSRFNGLLIDGCHLIDCGRNGINSWGNTNREKWYPSLNVVIRNNLLEGIPGDGIVPIGCSGALVERNIMRNCPDILSHEEAAAGMWPWSSDSTLIQFNEVSNHRAKWDGQGFDADYNCFGTIIQYNYSHHNNGGFLLVCNDGFSKGKNWNNGTYNTVVRYNLSVNDGLRPYPTERAGWFSPVMHITGPTNNKLITGNIVVQMKKEVPQMDSTTVKMDSWGGWPIETTLARNTFISEFDPIFSQGKDEKTVFSENQIIVKEHLGELSLTELFHLAQDTSQIQSHELKTFFEFIQSK